MLNIWLKSQCPGTFPHLYACSCIRQDSCTILVAHLGLFNYWRNNRNRTTLLWLLYVALCLSPPPKMSSHRSPQPNSAVCVCCKTTFPAPYGIHPGATWELLGAYDCVAIYSTNTLFHMEGMCNLYLCMCVFVCGETFSCPTILSPTRIETLLFTIGRFLVLLSASLRAQVGFVSLLYTQRGG